MKKFLVSLFFAALFVTGAYSAEKTIQVTQPVYHNMKFYVYKPVNVPKDFYVTFDGYLVYKDSKGVWNYGSNEKGGISKTGYVVGTVIPSVVRLKPYDAKISSVAPLLRVSESPQLPLAQVPPSAQALKSPRIVYTPPLSGLAPSNYSALSPHNPDWTQNSNFMAIGKWQRSIDRIGMISNPMIPVAWKGECPEVIYAWTGLQWLQLSAASKYIKAVHTLQSKSYDLYRYVSKVNMPPWTEDDIHVLSQYAVMWGYDWMGLIIIGKVY